jgi:hypothetical protein
MPWEGAEASNYFGQQHTNTHYQKEAWCLGVFVVTFLL